MSGFGEVVVDHGIVCGRNNLSKIFKDVYLFEGSVIELKGDRLGLIYADDVNALLFLALSP
jgi:hypothetical protein